MDLIIPKGTTTASKASQIRLNVECKQATASIVEFVDNVSTKTYDGVSTDYNNALLRLRFPSLDTEENTIAFTLQFPNKTIKDITQEMFLFSLTDNLPKAKTKNANAILAMHNEDGEPLYKDLKDFAKNYKLNGSTEKLYSILRENKTEFDLSDLSNSLEDVKIDVQSYFNTKSNEYTIASVKYNPPGKARVSSSNSSRTPRAKQNRYY